MIRFKINSGFQGHILDQYLLKSMATTQMCACVLRPSLRRRKAPGAVMVVTRAPGVVSRVTGLVSAPPGVHEQLPGLEALLQTLPGVQQEPAVPDRRELRRNLHPHPGREGDGGPGAQPPGASPL